MACLDIETDLARRFYGSLGPVALLYSDPPWSTGNAKSFRTKAGLAHDGVTLGRLWDCILERSLPLLGDSDLIVEIGSAHRLEIAALLARHGRAVTDAWEIVYYRKHRCWLLRSRKVARVDATSPAGLDDEVTPGWAILSSTSEGEFVCDPCMGRGLTVVAADKLGRRFVGSELNPRRLAVAIDRLATGRGLVPERVGSL